MGLVDGYIEVVTSRYQDKQVQRRLDVLWHTDLQMTKMKDSI